MLHYVLQLFKQDEPTVHTTRQVTIEKARQSLRAPRNKKLTYVYMTSIDDQS